MKNLEKQKKGTEKGITLVALVVTIVVLLILAGITITMLFGENGIIKKAQDAADATKNAQDDTVNGLANLESAMNAALGENGGGSGGNTVVEIATLKTDFAQTNTKAKDAQGNIVTVPKGFKVVEGTAGEKITVQNGVVIEDRTGNQFVWIPVGEVTLNDGTTKKEIILGRYTFAGSSAATPGEPALKQAAYTAENPTNYTSTVAISDYQELPTYREGSDVTTATTSDVNATAKDLAGFVGSVKINGGYYIARYEASNNGEKAQSKPNVTVWNNVKQVKAAKASREMYSDSDESIGVKSDLMNSYAWDTAIVYIQQMGINNLANKKYSDVGNKTSLVNTGSNSKDKFCNIYDMVANTLEWSTEYSTHTYGSSAYPCVVRGGVYNDSDVYSAYRSISDATLSGNGFGFRPLLYVK